MPTWGTTTANESKPNWLTDGEFENCYATPAGWALKHPDGSEELLVVVRGLDDRLAAPSITKVVFGAKKYQAGTTGTVKVSYNEKVAITGTPTLVVTGSIAGAITATYSGINSTKTTLSFTFTVPALGNTLTVGNQSISITSASIKELKSPGTLNANLTISGFTTSLIVSP